MLSLLTWLIKGDCEVKRPNNPENSTYNRKKHQLVKRRHDIRKSVSLS